MGNQAFGAYVVGPSVYNAGDVIQRVVVEHDPSAAQSLTTTHADVEGSDYTFTPKRADSEIIYTYSFQQSPGDADPIGHYKVLVDGVVETESEATVRFGSTSNEGRVSIEYLIQSWGVTAKEIKIQAREYGSANECKLHETRTWDGAASSKLSRAVLEIQEIATVGGNHGDYSITDAGMVKLAEATASADSSVDFTGIDSTYRNYLLVGSNLIPTSDGANMNLRVQASGSWQSGASDYSWMYGTAGVGSDSYSGDSSDSEFTIQGAVGKNGFEASNFSLWIYNPSAATYTYMSGHGWYSTLTPTYLSNHMGGMYMGTDAVTGFRVLPSTSTIASGELTLYGLK